MTVDNRAGRNAVAGWSGAELREDPSREAKPSGPSAPPASANRPRSVFEREVDGVALGFNLRRQR